MKKIRIIKIIMISLFLVSLFCTIDLGLNLLFNAEPSIHDNSYGVYSILHAVFRIFGDSLWSFERFFNAFSISMWISFALLVVNVILHCIKEKE